MATVRWAKPQGSWHPFKTVDLTKISVAGVYAIGYDSGDSRIATIYVGQGDDVSVRLQQHRSNAKILQYANKGTLRVTWAALSAKNRSGVERYVAEELDPLVGERHPIDNPIEVNLPTKWC